MAIWGSGFAEGKLRAQAPWVLAFARTTVHVASRLRPRHSGACRDQDDGRVGAAVILVIPANAGIQRSLPLISGA